MSYLEPLLAAAIDSVISIPGMWVHVGTVARDGTPHVTPMLMGRDSEHILLSLTGRQKRRNLIRNPAITISAARPQDHSHVIVWGWAEQRADDWAQARWEKIITSEEGPQMPISAGPAYSDGRTVLGVVHVVRYRVYGFPELSGLNS